MLNDLLDPVVLNKMLNAILLALIGAFFWEWLDERLGLPMHFILSANAFTVRDVGAEASHCSLSFINSS
jgi:hypothetical protein